MPDRLFSAEDAGFYLGNISARAVRQLVKDGVLRAKHQPVRGKRLGEKGARPRFYIAQSEIERYIQSLPEAGDPTAQQEQTRRRRLPPSIVRELEAASKYL